MSDPCETLNCIANTYDTFTGDAICISKHAFGLHMVILTQ